MELKIDERVAVAKANDPRLHPPKNKNTHAYTIYKRLIAEKKVEIRAQLQGSVKSNIQPRQVQKRVLAPTTPVRKPNAGTPATATETPIPETPMAPAQMKAPTLKILELKMRARGNFIAQVLQQTQSANHTFGKESQNITPTKKTTMMPCLRLSTCSTRAHSRRTRNRNRTTRTFPTTCPSKGREWICATSREKMTLASTTSRKSIAKRNPNAKHRSPWQNRPPPKNEPLECQRIAKTIAYPEHQSP
eukprot:scaffold1923_cov160-Amphora_coffeaeformis.AAC.11